MRIELILSAFLILLAACSSDSAINNATNSGDNVNNKLPLPDGGDATGGDRQVTCNQGDTPSAEVAAPTFIQNLRGQTSWYASPVIADLDGDGKNELIAAYYDVYIFDSNYQEIGVLVGGEGRVYAPHVVIDLEGDGITEIVYGSDHQVWAYEWKDGAPVVKAGWPVDTTTAGQSPEVRGMAAGDLDGDGLIEIVVTTTQTMKSADGGAQVFVYSPNGESFQPAGQSFPAWPRYNALTGVGGDADRNGQGHNGFGCYGLNVGIGNIDDDPDLEVLATYDNHHIQAFKHTGVAIDSAPFFKNRENEFKGERLTWGQFIRWADPAVEAAHYNAQTGEWPNPEGQEWLQWTASPPSVVDLDGDGKNEVIGVPNVEMDIPYDTKAYAVMVLEGNYGDGSRSAMRKDGWETLPRGEYPIKVEGYYPPGGLPSPAIVNIQGDANPEIIVSLNDGFIYAFDASAKQVWRVNYTGGKALYASEPTVADLNQDGVPEVLVATYGSPDVPDAGQLLVISSTGELLHAISLPDPGENGNGAGAPAAPTVGDLNGDGELEIFVQTFDHGMDVFTVPGSGTNCLVWPTARGGPLRTGAPNE